MMHAPEMMMAMIIFVIIILRGPLAGPGRSPGTDFQDSVQLRRELPWPAGFLEGGEATLYHRHHDSEINSPQASCDAIFITCSMG